MASDEVDRLLRSVVEPIAAAHELAVEGVRIRVRGRLRTVVVVLDLADGPGALGSDLLADVTREVSDALDAVDVPGDAYTLEVSTPGVTRPLTTPRHFRRAQRRLLRVELTDGTALTGRVTSADDDGVTLTAVAPVGAPTGARSGGRGAAPETRTLTYPQIASAVVEVELRRVQED
ncbi:ribosome maturation factor RimP [Litorihabitans aurantiacus]|uniref:Ribosome maturation factor RimP n=1 Tax=Litorihabitans aurantiacus TaxID=1930061 RepID=A0AA37XEN5_9MICO|nr:ribosome maturation factor RimP [Litorihabitans aurantiacus]GMA31784.1 ribosome maturation factor RimP [Litorihabitans aurantiacus]